MFGVQFSTFFYKINCRIEDWEKLNFSMYLINCKTELSIQCEYRKNEYSQLLRYFVKNNQRIVNENCTMKYSCFGQLNISCSIDHMNRSAKRIRISIVL